MPIVRVSLFEGRSLDKKRQLVNEITAIVASVCEVDREGVHVLIDEMSRDNWGRGGMLHRDRGPKPSEQSTIGRTSFRSVSWVTVRSGRLETYLAYRREHVNPTMATMPGFLGSITAQDVADKNRLLVFNRWADEDAWHRYQATSEHDGLRDRIRGELVESMSIGRYATTDLPHSAGLDVPANAGHHMTVSTHRVKTGCTNLYLGLRRSSVHPTMAEFAGFVSSNALESLDEPYAFLIVNTWESPTAADSYGASREHDVLRDQVRALLSEHAGTRQYEVLGL